jgi:hypothetical protein
MQQIILKDNNANNGKYSTRRFIMLSFLKKIFGSKPAESTAVPYKVEKSESKVAEFPFPSVKPAQAEKKPAVKKSTPATKTKPARKPRAPKA